MPNDHAAAQARASLPRLHSPTTPAPNGRGSPYNTRSAAGWETETRAAYRGAPNAMPEQVASIRRQRALEASAEHRAHSPVFAARSNSEMSYVNTVTPPAAKPIRHDDRPPLNLVFKETSSSRASYHPPTPADYPPQAGGPARKSAPPLAFSAQSECNRQFKAPNATRPVRAKEQPRKMPHVKFAATTESRSVFVEHPLPEHLRGPLPVLAAGAAAGSQGTKSATAAVVSAAKSGSHH